MLNEKLPRRVSLPTVNVWPYVSVLGDGPQGWTAPTPFQKLDVSMRVSAAANNGVRAKRRSAKKFRREHPPFEGCKSYRCTDQ